MPRKLQGLLCTSNFQTIVHFLFKYIACDCCSPVLLVDRYSMFVRPESREGFHWSLKWEVMMKFEGSTRVGGCVRMVLK